MSAAGQFKQDGVSYQSIGRTHIGLSADPAQDLLAEYGVLRKDERRFAEFFWIEGVPFRQRVFSGQQYAPVLLTANGQVFIFFRAYGAHHKAQIQQAFVHVIPDLFCVCREDVKAYLRVSFLKCFDLIRKGREGLCLS